ncbi:MAG: shikimate dehydrogenase [Cyanobacteria bacterium P01_D01_bin.123]
MVIPERDRIACTIDGSTQLLGLIGNPVSHSLSPAMHNAAIASLGLNFAYLPFPVAPHNVGAAVGGMAALGIRGFNITIPHKQAIRPFLQATSDTAHAVGAVNTVYRLPDGSWGGTNTDVEGFTRPLPERDWRGRTVTILGAGGAARAVIQGCLQLGFAGANVVARSPERLALLQANWPDFVRPVLWQELNSVLAQSHLMANATPIGMHSDTDPEAEMRSPLSANEFAQLPSDAIVYDLIYVPRPTQFLSLAAQRGLIAIDGLEMLVQQGAIALSLWLGGREVPVDVMRAAAESQLHSSQLNAPNL